MTLGNTAKYVRSKNAGPFWMTIDIFCDSPDDYLTICGSKELTEEKLAEIYQVAADSVKKFQLDDLRIVKFSMPRPVPQGSCLDGDMHAGQQYTRIMDMEL